jgi:hypothetical protein
LRLAVGADDPGQAEHEVLVVRIEERAEPLDRLDLEPRLFAELAAQAVERLLALLEEPAGESQWPRRSARGVRQHPAVALEDALDARDRVAPVPLSASHRR